MKNFKVNDPFIWCHEQERNYLNLPDIKFFPFSQYSKLGNLISHHWQMLYSKKGKCLFEFYLSDYLCHSKLSSGTICCLHYIMRLSISLSDQ